MKIKPILFSTEMVRAILAGRKTQTRRIAKAHGCGNKTLEFATYVTKAEVLNWSKPKYQIGDELWVRETFCYFNNQNVYKADIPDTEIRALEIFGHKWKPSIFMPQDACRIYLEVTDIRIEKLDDITEEDAKAEGVKTNSQNGIDINGEWYNYTASDFESFPCYSAKESFKTLWKSINEKKTLNNNPYVWVIEFHKKEVSDV